MPDQLTGERLGEIIKTELPSRLVAVCGECDKIVFDSSKQPPLELGRYVGDIVVDACKSHNLNCRGGFDIKMDSTENQPTEIDATVTVNA